MSNIDPKARTWAEIDMAALKHNFEIAKRTGKKVLCVIKANAYGHGAVHCGLFLEKQGADFFAVACLSEAIELREGGITKPILILGYTPEKYAETLAKYDITQAEQDGKKTFPFTSGSNLYDFIAVDELANMIVAASVQEEINGIINVCTGKPMSLADRVEQFLRDKNYKIKLDYGAFPDRPYDSPGTWGDPTKINRILANDTCKRA